MSAREDADNLIIEKLLLDFDDFEMLEMVRDHLIELQESSATRSEYNVIAIDYIDAALRCMENRPQEELQRKI
ncbi:hypothetical protein [Ruminococcus flavefaciens]|uniref:hypothetical protein n=1 Tax=Ruminococcus flavefaciens TaxID=1265 RepID=UPI0026EA928E|nr:hypothetical protein [Ruminococcus flavefaciens]